MKEVTKKTSPELDESLEIRKQVLAQRDEGAVLPVAIIGNAFRFPGDHSDESIFWNALKAKQDLIGQIPESRWATSELQHDKLSEPGCANTFSAGVLSDIDKFDPSFFGISPREAAWLDPQQRLLLELSWEAMENAGVLPSSLAGSDCAVYVGISSVDYGMRGLDDLASLSSHFMTGNTLSIAANRLSYAFDLHGPSLAVDTACSSSLVALHHACNCLRSGEASSAIVGGVNLLLHPYPFVGFTKASMLSADGRSKAFDASANGYVRSEGSAVVMLKPLDKAITDGNDIQAVILASGINTDGGRKTGITIPSCEGQAELMGKVLAQSGLSAHEVDYIEAHGTGTPVGDPIEAAAIAEVYGQGRGKALPIGSVKANLGHMEAASGIAGLIKALLVLKNRELPPALHLNTPNPNIDFAGLNLELITERRDLVNESGKPLVVGVNSFGFGGANAHVLLQEPPPQISEPSILPNTLVPPLFLSARNEDALFAMGERYATMLSDKSLADYYDITYATAYQRERQEHRLALAAESIEDGTRLLSQYAQGESPKEVIIEKSLPQGGSVAFVYSGNGSQWVGMGRTLLAESSKFLEIITRLDAQIRPLTGYSVIEELAADGTAARLDDTVVAQPLLFAIQVACTVLLKELGVEPAAVTGHSVGEIAAAWAAGALDIDQAIRIIVARSAAQGKTRSTGKMAAVGLSESGLKAVLEELGDDFDVTIAGINSPNHLTLSGSLIGLERIQVHLREKGVFFRLLDIDYAFHSRQMDPIKEFLGQSLRGLEPSSTKKTAFVSTVVGDVLGGTKLDALYWWRNVREPVRFADAVVKLADLGCRTFIEIGPRAILKHYITESLDAAAVKARVLTMLRRGADGQDKIVETALRTHLLADQPNLEVFFPKPGGRVRLPNYPWQRERHWHPSTSESLGAIMRRRIHPLLGWRLYGAEMAWENNVDPVSVPWLVDHKVGGTTVFPGSAYAEMALAAAREWLGGERLTIEALDIVSPMVFVVEDARTVRFILDPRDGGFQIRSRQRLSTDEWTLHAAGRVLVPYSLKAVIKTKKTGGTLKTGSLQTSPKSLTRIISRLPGVEVTDRSSVTCHTSMAEPKREVESETHYRLTAALGLDYGPAFQGLKKAYVSGDRLEVVFSQPCSIELDHGYLVHPAILDVCFQTLVDFFQPEIEQGQGAAFLPVKIGRLDIHRYAEVRYLHAHLRHRGKRSVLADFELLDDSGELVATVTGCRFRVAPMLLPKQPKVSTWNIIPVLCPHPVESLMSDLPSANALIRLSREGLAEVDEERRTWFKETLPLIETLTLLFAYEAFQALVQKDQDVLPHLVETPSPYVRWITGLLRQEGLLYEQDGQWTVDTESDLPEAEAIWHTLLHENPSCLPQLSILGRVGLKLPDLLADENIGREIYATLQNLPVADSLITDDPAYRGVRIALENNLLQLASSWPKHRRLRVLEIAAGPSELPHKLLDALAEDRLDYVLALDSEQYCERQEVEYQEFANVTVASFNYDDWELTADDSLINEFDVIILRHVLHRSSNPHAALVQAKCWLACGGVLMLAERHPDWSADFVAGLDPAWWHVDNAEGSGSKSTFVSSLLGPDAWLQALREDGFDDIGKFVESEAEGLDGGAFLLFAKRSLSDVNALDTPEDESWLLVVDDDSKSVADKLRIKLEYVGQSVVVTDQVQEKHLVGVEHVVNLLGWKGVPEDAASLLTDLLGEVQVLGALNTPPPHLWIVTCGGALVSGQVENMGANPAQSALWGFGRVVMNEYPALDCTLIDLGSDPDSQEILLRLENELLYPDGENEIIIASMARYTLSLREEGTPSSVFSGETCYRLDFHMPGKLRNAVWLPEKERPLLDDEVEVATKATGLNFRDIMYLMGLLPDEAVENGFAGANLGLEFSGVVTRVGSRVRDHQPGDAVLGFGSSCFASHVVTPAIAVVPMPRNWSFEAAATVPTVYFTVYYALQYLADLQPGERVLIHGAAGGVGIAAIRLARHLGAEIFATAGSDEKRDFVRLLGADHVFDSRSLDFAENILAVTGGEGVDVVLNSLAGEAIRRNLSVLKPFGRFLELGKRDFFENTPIGLRFFKDNISYFGIDVDQLLLGRPQLAARLLRDVMILFQEGVLSPLPYRVFKAERVVDAFYEMMEARHIGKVVVSFDDSRPPVHYPVPMTQAVQFDSESTWIVTGGLDGFGLESARWIASRGAGHLVLINRRGIETPGAREAIDELVDLGVTVSALSCDVTDAKALSAIIDRVRKTMPPLKGILHAAMVIDDQLIMNLNGQNIEAVLSPKLIGAWNLHLLTKDIPLEYFVLYSSVTTSIGNPGQANYVAANAALEGLARLRHSMGLPVSCIGWGPIGNVGYLTRNTDVRDNLAQRLGKSPLTAVEALNQMDTTLSTDNGLITVANFDWRVLSSLLPFATSSRFGALNYNVNDVGNVGDTTDLRALIANKTPEEVTSIVRTLVIQEVAQVLLIKVDRIDANISLHDYGLDSLMAVDLAHRLEQSFGVQLPVMMLNESPTAVSVALCIIEKISGNTSSDIESQAESLVRDMVRQHGEQVKVVDIHNILERDQEVAMADGSQTT